MWNEGRAIEQECAKLEEAVALMFREIGLNDPPDLDWWACDVRQQNASCEAFEFEWLFQQERPYQNVWFRSSRFPDAIISLNDFEWIANPPGITATASELFASMGRFETLNDAVPYLRLRLPEIRNVMNNSDLPELGGELRRLKMRAVGVEPN